MNLALNAYLTNIFWNVTNHIHLQLHFDILFQCILKFARQRIHNNLFKYSLAWYFERVVVYCFTDNMVYQCTIHAQSHWVKKPRLHRLWYFRITIAAQMSKSEKKCSSSEAIVKQTHLRLARVICVYVTTVSMNESFRRAHIEIEWMECSLRQEKETLRQMNRMSENKSTRSGQNRRTRTHTENSAVARC